MRDAVIVAYARSAIGKGGKKGSLKETRPDDIAAQVLLGLLKRVPQVDPMQIDDFVLGAATTEGPQGMNLAKIVLDRANLPYQIPGMTVNRYCATSLQAIVIAAQAIMTGQADIMIAGGVESMSMVPQGGHMFSPNPWLVEHRPGQYTPMGETAENVANRYNVTREEMDQMSYESNMRAAKAIADGKFEDEIIPIEAVRTVVNEKGEESAETFIFNKDECYRANCTHEGLAGLKPAFDPDGNVTAGNSSQNSDGSAMVMLMSSEKADELGVKKLARLVDFAVGGVEAEYMGEGPMVAVPKVMKKSGFKVEDMDLIELNEAFAAQAIPCIKNLGMNPAKVNVNGGAIALGHPMGATGAWLTIKLITELRRRHGRYGLVTMCIGGGMGAAGIFEALY